MTPCSRKIKHITLILVFEFYRSLPTLLRGCICIYISAFLVSCAIVPQQTYLNNSSLTGINKVAIVVSVNAPNVSYSINSPAAGSGSMWAVILGPLVGIPAMGIEAAIRSGEDQEHATRIKEHIDFSSIEAKMAQYFIEPIKKNACFKSMEYVKDKTQDTSLLLAIGYDAVIRVDVSEISIQRAPGDYVSLSAQVHGQMEHLSSGKIVWDRRESFASSEPHTLDYYKENGLKELDVLLEKAGKNLSYDFIYLK